MTTRSDIDSELLDLVRAVDPMRDPQVQASAGLDTESALRLLAPRLDHPPASRRARGRRRTLLRTAVLGTAIAAVVFVVANVASTGNGPAVSQAEAQTILRHIRDDLKWPPHAIYEQETVGTVTARDGATFTSESHEWISTSPPYNMRTIEIWNGKVAWEQAFVSGRRDLYDPRANTVYLEPGVAPGVSTDQPQWNSALSEVQSLLSGKPQCRGCEYPNVTINTHATLDGKPAIELTFVHGRFSYWISPRTYQPLQVEDRADSLPDGQGGVGIGHFPIARVLTGRAATPRLLSLQAQHPGATVDHSITEYEAAVSWMQHLTPSVKHCGRSPARTCQPSS